jgi:hypothetical protein
MVGPRFTSDIGDGFEQAHFSAVLVVRSDFEFDDFRQSRFNDGHSRFPLFLLDGSCGGRSAATTMQAMTRMMNRRVMF